MERPLEPEVAIHEEYMIEYFESTEGADPMRNGTNLSEMQSLETPKMEKRPQIYTCYVKEEPRPVEEVLNDRSHYDDGLEANISHEEMPSCSTMHENFIPETIIPDVESPDSNVLLEPRKRGRPKKKPISVLTPMEISNNHDARATGESVESLNEHLYAGFLGRTRRTVRQHQDDSDERGLSEESETEDYFSARRGRPFGSIKNRGRGRGRSRARGTVSINRRGRGRGRGEVPSHYEDMDGIEEMETDHFTDEPDHFFHQVYPDVKCGKCSEEFSKREWNRHNLFKHNNTGWLDGETPIDYNANEKLLKKVLMSAIKKKKGQLSCEQCGTIKRSVVGFLSHIRFCGKSETEKLDLMVQCPKCNSSVKPTSMYTHERNCQKDKLTVSFFCRVGTEENPELNTSPGKSKRRAAEKAVSKISEFTTAVSSNTEKISPHTVRHFIQKPRLERKIGARLKNSFFKELELKGFVSCRQPGCEFYGRSLETISEHYAKCNFEIQENYICKICNMHSLIQKEIMDHVLEKHSTADNSDFCEDPDHQVKSEESSEASEVENETPRTRTAAKLRFLPDQPDEKLRAYRAEFLDKDLSQNPKKNIPFSLAYRWTLEFELSNYELQLFNDLMPHEFVLLSEEESKCFLPELQLSMAMKIQFDEEPESSNSDTLSSEWSHWQRFEGRIEKEVPTFFVGGPVWAISWLPIPIPMFSFQPTQYLAVSTHPKMESEYSVGQSYAEKNVLQIWDLGNLYYKKSTLSIPKLAYAVAHNGGTIWCMEWCPSGCYQDDKIAKFDKNPVKTRRMGLLATACSDGFVHIYSLPFPDDLSVLSEKNQLPIYKANPVQTLVVNIALTESEKQTWQCTKLSWTKENGHNILAAGFSNGYIALWNLATQSLLLKKKQGNTMLINSFRHFYAHNHSVSMISMIPYGEKRFLVSAGIDRCYKVWDLEQPNCIECVTTRGLTVDGAWMNNWPCSVLSYDDALGLSHTNSQLIPLREHSYKYFPVLATNSPTYAISVSDHANAIAQGNLAGEIVAIFPHQVLYKDIENYLSKKRWLCSYVEVTDFKAADNLDENQSETERKQYRYKPTTYAECSERFGISFSEDFKNFRTCKAKDLKEKVMPSDQLETVSIEQYPFASINRISWNPNAWSYLWFAAGYQNGFIRVLNFNSVAHVEKVTKLLPQFAKEVLQKENKGDESDRPEQNDENEQNLM